MSTCARSSIARSATAAPACPSPTVDQNGTRAVVGLIQVRQLDPSFEAAEWECTLAPSVRGTGVFLEAARLVGSFAFGTVGARRLEARVLLQNGRANGALRKLGAVQEGVLRRSVRRAANTSIRCSGRCSRRTGATTGSPRRRGSIDDASWRSDHERATLRARLYVGAVIVAGVALLAGLSASRDLRSARCCFSFLHRCWPRRRRRSRSTLPLTTSGSTMSVSYAVDFASLLLLGPHETMLVAAGSAFSQCHLNNKERNPLYRTLFSMAVARRHRAGRRPRVQLLGGGRLDAIR